MYSRSAALVVLLVVVVRAEDSSLEECFKRGSVDCVRDYVSRSVRSLLGEESADLFEEVVLKTDDTSEGSAVSVESESGKSLSVKDPRKKDEVVVGGVLGEDSSSSIGDLSEDKANNGSGITFEGTTFYH